jgi:hypothetical protein
VMDKRAETCFTLFNILLEDRVSIRGLQFLITNMPAEIARS